MTYSPTGRLARDPVETILREDTVPNHVVEVGDQYFLGLESGRQRRLHGRFGDPTDPTSSDGAPTGQVATERERLGRKRARAQLDREALQPQGLGLVAPGIRQDRRQGRGEIQEASAATAGQEAGGLRRAHAHLLGIHHVGDTGSPVRLRREVPREQEEHLGHGGVRLAPQGLGERVEGKEAHLGGAAARRGGRPQV